ncbi:SipW-dependent-type signal peptide-containing protein [Nesterenkonia flava]|uniref:SipW-dependent-type signal peptide-containing protein n=1 Tax=Nesterenkonia flava TaxID=469799 RepID=A0ABU1FVD6_9MICC|nr:SipW-dependent-type signal peptide-containing protein [Nesterenkonia flava]MDR5712583.1 SipW-dependent-type signal peptide-containing protein [Nesterenkonia flava]
MSETIAATTNSHSTHRRRKIQAVLAAGAVLGIGAAVTLANWSDSVFTQGQFGSSAFGLEGSASGAAESFTSHEDATDAVSLPFDAADMAPNSTVYAPYWVRLTAESTVPGVIAGEGGISIESPAGNPNTGNLGYTVYALDSDGACDTSGVAGATAIASANTFASGPASGPGSETLAPGEDSAAGEAVQLCFEVTAGEDLVQGETTNALWTITATSVND